jgi:phosphohistidine phosphatase SixA
MKHWSALLLWLLPLSSALADDSAAWSAFRAITSNAIVLFRHAEAPGFGDPDNFRLGDCTTQRNLATAGRRQASRIGERFATERISVGKVLSSQWCRTLETAELAFPGQVTTDATFNSFFNDRQDEPRQTEQARSLLSAWRGPGALVVVTHQVNITALTGIVPGSGEGVVLRFDQGKPVIIGRISP